MSLDVKVVGSSRKRGFGCNPVIKWKYMITTGPRCAGLESRREYDSGALAYDAGLRMTKKLKGE